MRATAEAAILKKCEALFPSVVAFTRDMISQYSVLGQESGTLQVVEKRLKELGLPVARVPMKRALLSASPLYAPVEWDHEEKYNLVSSLNPGAAGRSLVLNGHVDVVSADPFDMWAQAPNLPWERDGWLYGRGAGDMQSGVAAMIYALHAVRDAGYRIVSPLTVHVVVEEECSGNGALACLQHGYTGDFVLIPEPFGPCLYTGQVGVLWLKVSVTGVPAHAFAASQGVNAVEKLWRIVPFLKALEDELNTRHRVPPFDEYAHPYNLNIGRITGGNWASSVPAYAELEARIGFPPAMSAAEIMKRVQDVVARASATVDDRSAEPARVRFHGFRSEGHLVDLEHPGIELLAQCHGSLTGQQIGRYLSTCTTDLRAFHFYDRTGGTCYGPVARNIHGIDECVNLESVLQTMKSYALFIARWCETARA